jgi:sec-independent protein translocase protein TatA
MLGLRMPELLLILAVVVLLFGANKLPQLGQGLGEGLKSFKKAFREAKEDDERAALSEHASTTQPNAAKSTETAAKR